MIGDTTGGGTPTTVLVHAINIEIEYATEATPSPTDTATPSPTATPEPSPTDTAEPTPTDTPTATPTDVPSETPTETPTPTPTDVPSETPTETPTPTATPTATVVSTPTRSAPATPAGMGYYHPVAPYRILDTRTGPQGVPGGKVGPASEITVDVTGGASGVPETDVSAVVINTTVTEPTAAGYLTVFPSDESRPLTSNLNFAAGQTVPNLVTVKVGGDGSVKVYNAAGQVHVIFDIVGWYGGAEAGSLFNGVDPVRILDTRDGTGATGKVGPGATIDVDVTDTEGSGVPPTDVAAVVVNTTVTEVSADSYLTVFPSDATQPLTSNLNFVAGQTVANLVTVKVGGDGNVKVFNAAGSTHVIFDVVGWYGASGDQFHSLSPSRILDTRTGPQGTPPGKVGGNAEIDVGVAGAGNVPGSGASNVVLNATVTAATVPSYLTIHSTDVTTPAASNLNFGAGQTVPNLAIVTIGADGNVTAYNAAGEAHVIFDVVGYFGP